MRDGLVKRGTTWSYVVRARDPETGRPKPRWVGGFKSRAAAKAARDEARHDLHTGSYVPPQDLTVAEYLRRWVQGHAVELKPSTAASYRANIERYLIPAMGHERLQELSPDRISVVLRNLYERGGTNGAPLSPRTVEFARAVLRRAMQDAVLARHIKVNPVVGTKRPRVAKPKHTTWTGQQLAGFLEHITDHRLAPLFGLAAATGMRRGEVLALRWSDVDLDNAVLLVERSVHVGTGGRSYSAPKNHERRRVSLDPRTVASLKAWRKVQAADRLAWAGAWQDSEGLLFTREDGTPVPPDYVSKVFGVLQAGAGLPRVTLHELRHTHATVLLRDGVPVHVVAKRLGHRDPSVTLNVYADVIPDDDGRAVDVFTRAVYGA